VDRLDLRAENFRGRAIGPAALTGRSSPGMSPISPVPDGAAEEFEGVDNATDEVDERSSFKSTTTA